MTGRALRGDADAPEVTGTADVSVILMVEAETAGVGPGARRERGPGIERIEVAGPRPRRLGELRRIAAEDVGGRGRGDGRGREVVSETEAGAGLGQVAGIVVEEIFELDGLASSRKRAKIERVCGEDLAPASVERL